MNKIFFKLKNKGTKIVAYADDVVLLIVSKFLPTISELMLNKIQILSCLSITGATKSTPHVSLEVILDIPPLIFSTRTLLLSPSLD